jgi:enediyne biosynthesis protein E4
VTRARGGLARRAATLLALIVAGCSDGAPDASRNPASKEPPPPPPTPFSRVFVDVAAEAGLAFRHEAGGSGRKLLPETMGTAPIVFDADGDGRLDLYVPNGRPLDPKADGPGGRLYRNLGGLRFSDATEAAGLSLRDVYAFGGAAGDFDGDGDDDLYVVALESNRLLRNDGGVFVDVTAEAGVGGGMWRDASGVEHPEWSSAAAWFDADADGDLDLFVVNYVAWTPEIDVFTTLDGVTKAFTTPDRYVGLPCRFFRNEGGGKFVDASEAAGLLSSLGKGLGLSLWDFDDDGLLDVVVANDTRPNFLFMNKGGGRFEERGLSAGVAYDENGRARAGMGIDVAADLGDGVPCVAIGNFSGEPMSLYRRTPSGVFQSSAEKAGLGAPTIDPLTFGLQFLDVDLDGRLDLALANGHLEPDVGRTGGGRAYAQAASLFRGVGGGRYVDVSAEAGPDFQRPRVGRGLSYADFDDDGDLDLVVATNGLIEGHGALALLENRPRDSAAPPAPKSLRVVVRGKPPNPRALGAKVELLVGPSRDVRFIRTGSSYGGQSDVYPTFGLSALPTDAAPIVRTTFHRRGGAPGAIVDRPVPKDARTLVVDEP